MPNPYEILQVSPTASPAVIRAVWAALIKECHPDQGKPKEKTYREKRTRELNEAYAILKDPQKRAALDIELEAQKPSKHPRDRRRRAQDPAPDIFPGAHQEAYPAAYEGFSTESVDEAIDELTRAAQAPKFVGEFFKFVQREARRPK